MFPFIASSMSLSVGTGIFASKAEADIIWPAWQYPHCGTSISSHASCTGCVPSAESPSIVVMGALAAAATGVWQLRTALPLRCTVHAPHWPMPQPYFVPFSFRTSRMAHNRGMSAGTSTVVDRPFTVSWKAIGSLLFVDLHLVSYLF